MRQLDPLTKALIELDWTFFPDVTDTTREVCRYKVKGRTASKHRFIGSYSEGVDYILRAAENKRKTE